MTSPAARVLRYAFIAAMSPEFVLRMCDADLELLDAAEGLWVSAGHRTFLFANLAHRYEVAS